jgi:hypothetical protein
MNLGVRLVRQTIRGRLEQQLVFAQGVYELRTRGTLPNMTFEGTVRPPVIQPNRKRF